MNHPSSAEACLLDVKRSLSGRRWLSGPGDDRLAMALSQRLAVPEIVGRIMSARGIALDEAEAFLAPTLRDTLPDPAHLKDMEVGVERLASAVMQGESVAIFGDYDVDGATSAALLKRFLEAVGGRAVVYIPDRLSEGYGPSAEALLSLKNRGASVVVTVDCGTGSHDALQEASAAGLDVIVVDHHIAEASLPTAVAVINPNRLDETSAHGQLAAVGVTFLFIIALNRTLRKAGWYGARREPNALNWLDLVALGTVCDAVPLTGVNRALVAQGLKVMAARINVGLTALADVAGIDEAPGTYHAGFVLGPRINAGGRVGDSDLGVRLLSTDDVGEARDIAARLDLLNTQRQGIEAAVFDDALAQVAESDVEPDTRRCIFAVGEGWHAGVVGIIASRLKERFAHPACVISMDGDTGSGSGRSVSGFDLGAAIIAARQSGLLVRGGGHAMAAGFTVERGRLAALSDFLNERARAAHAENGIEPSLHVDATLSVTGASLDLVETLSRLAPFGTGNPEPRFAIAAARLRRVDIVGEKHLRCSIAGESGPILNAIAFRSVDTPLGQAFLHNDGKPFHIAGRLRGNSWRGRTTPQLLIDDAASAW